MTTLLNANQIDGGLVKPFPTLAAAVADTNLQDGDELDLAEYFIGTGGGGRWYVELLSAGAANTYNRVAWGGNTGAATDLVLVLREQPEIDILDFGAVFDGVTDDSAAFIAAADYLSSGGIINMPSGTTLISNLPARNSLFYVGKGLSTILKVSGVGAYGFKSLSHDTGLAADGVSYGGFWDFQFNFTLGSQASISYVGLSRWSTKRVYNVFGSIGATGFECKPTVLAGSGGPAQWYNSFEDCFNIGTSAAKTAGAIGWNIGGTLATDEQATTWRITGGRTNLCQIGVWLKGATAINFYDHVTESCDDNWILGTTGAGERSAKECNIYGMYVEGGVNGLTLNVNTLRNNIYMPFMTSITGTDVTDNGAANNIFGYASQWTLKAAKYIVETISSNYPQITGLKPGLELIDSALNNVRLVNSTATSSAGKRLVVSDGTNDLLGVGS